MEKTEKIDFVLTMMKKLLAHQEVRLQNGLRKRNEIRAAIQRGEIPKGYRMDWLRDSGYEVISLLTKIAQKFDKQHPTDKASVNDLIDILSTTSLLLQKFAKEQKSMAAVADEDDEGDDGAN